MSKWFANGFDYVRFPNEPIAGLDDRWPYDAVKAMLTAADLTEELKFLEAERKRREKTN